MVMVALAVVLIRVLHMGEVTRMVALMVAAFAYDHAP